MTKYKYRIDDKEIAKKYSNINRYMTKGVYYLESCVSENSDKRGKSISRR